MIGVQILENERIRDKRSQTLDPSSFNSPKFVEVSPLIASRKQAVQIEENVTTFE
jgi:hypothetical protein